MRKNLGAKPFTYPQPVFIIAAYDENGLPNAMNAAWGGISEMNEISICISEGHKTTANILKRKAFTVSMAEAGQIIACDYVGIVSGNKVPDTMVSLTFAASSRLEVCISKACVTVTSIVVFFSFEAPAAFCRSASEVMSCRTSST